MKEELQEKINQKHLEATRRHKEKVTNLSSIDFICIKFKEFDKKIFVMFFE